MPTTRKLKLAIHKKYIMFNHQEAFDNLFSTVNGLKIHSLNLVEYEYLDLHPKDLLAKIGLDPDALIEFEVEDQNYGVHNGGSTNANINGITVLVESGASFEPVVFVQKQPPMEMGQSDELYNHWKYLTNLCALAHELGHVEDIQRKENSNFIISKNVSINLIKAEIYAHTYCLQHLGDIGADTARCIMAKGIYEAAINGRKFQQEVYAGICKNLGKGRVKKWIKK